MARIDDRTNPVTISWMLLHMLSCMRGASLLAGSSENAWTKASTTSWGAGR